MAASEGRRRGAGENSEAIGGPKSRDRRSFRTGGLVRRYRLSALNSTRPSAPVAQPRLDRQTLRDGVHRLNGSGLGASSTTGRRVPSLAFFGVDFHPTSESSSRNSASPPSVRGPVIQLRARGPSRLSKTYGPPRLHEVDQSSDPVCHNVSDLEGSPPGHDGDSRASGLIKPPASIAPFFEPGFRSAV